MHNNLDRQEAIRIAKEKMQKKKEKEAREEKEFYERITSGTPWLIFKFVVAFCTLVLLISTIEVFVDGPTKKLDEEAWSIDKNWEYRRHTVLNVEGYMFAPQNGDWFERIENSLNITYSPILKVGKKLSYDVQENKTTIRRHVETRARSIFTWFPEFQLLLLIPLLTFIFRQQSAWFNFARITSLIVVFPGTLMVIYFAIF
ncbi:hypothetical protein [Brumimicrobium sp.]|uniref:hypothetical protein n=1 Tax=Brumimicrobium sp. TaxID=2029867 RepID=UPI002D1B965E|nr:hypothetical protein [Flavobacterium sp.]